jgi:hypothetical protein
MPVVLPTVTVCEPVDVMACVMVVEKVELLCGLPDPPAQSDATGFRFEQGGFCQPEEEDAMLE